MADNKVREIIECMQILAEKKELNIDQELLDDVNSTCDPSPTVKCSCHIYRNGKLDAILNKKINIFLSHVENVNMKDFVENQGNLINLTECLCYGFNNQLFQPVDCVCDLRWQFVKICLKTLLALINSLYDVEDTELQEHMQPDENIIPNIIGVHDEEAISQLIEIVTTFGISSNLLTGVGRPVKLKTDFQTLLPKQKIRPRKLFLIIHVLVSAMKNKTLHSIILSQNSNDIIASLIQLCYCPVKANLVTLKSQCCCTSEENSFQGCVNCSGDICAHEKNWCEAELDYLLLRTYQPYIIKELLILQRCATVAKKARNKWFQKVIGYKLSKCMMQENGVKYVMEGILAGCDADSMNWSRYNSIGKLIAHVPAQVATAVEYYKLVSPQILKFLDVGNSIKTSHAASTSVGSQYTMVMIACIQEMLELNFQLAEKYIFMTMLGPLQRFFAANNTIELHGVPISKCVASLYMICSIGVDLSEKLMSMLAEILHPLFVILCLHRGETIRKGVCSILVYILDHIKSKDSLNFLKLFMFEKVLPDPTTDVDAVKMKAVSKEVRFTNGIQDKEISLTERKTVSVEDISTEEKVSNLLLLLQDKQLEDMRGEFFVGLLEQLSRLLQSEHPKTNKSKSDGTSSDLLEIDNTIADIQHKIQLVSLISALIDNFGYSILQNTPQTVAFIKGILDLPWKDVDDDDISLDDGFHEETVDMVLMLVSFLLKTEKLTPSDFVLLHTLIPSLERAASKHSQRSSRALANDLKVYIATRGAVKPDEASNNESTNPRNIDPSSIEAYQAALKDLTDPLLPTRGHALFQLSKLLKCRNKYAVKDHKRLLDIFEMNLAHHDTYLYLAAVEGLLALVDVRHKEVLPLLCRKFAQFHGDDEPASSSDLRIKLGEALVKSCRLCGDMLPAYTQILLAALLTGVKDEDFLVRASSLSAIGDVCQLSKFSIGTMSTEIVSCIRHVVSTDTSVEVRRAAVQVFALMFKGIGSRIMQAIPDSMRDIHRMLKSVVENDDDETTRLHASNALDFLDNVVKATLFPKTTLEKKIQILGNS